MSEKASRQMPKTITPTDGVLNSLYVDVANNEPKTEQEVFEMQIARFYDYIDHITMRYEPEVTSEQKRQNLQEKYPIDKFKKSIYDIFGDEVKLADIKQLYRKISANPDAEVDWSSVFGYGGDEEDSVQWRASEAKEKQGDDVIDDDKVIVTKLRRQVADAAGGSSKRRDIVKQIIYIPHADHYCFISQHGLVQVVSAGRYTPVTSMQVQQGDMLTTACCWLPNLRRLVVASDKQLFIWDYRSPSREAFVITPMPANILCISPIVCEKSEGLAFEDGLLFGDVEGCVGIIRIHQKDLSSKSPHKKSGSSDEANKKDGIIHIVDSAKLTVPIYRKKIHTDWTVRVLHCPDLKMFASCSPSSKTSFIAEEMQALKSDKPFTKFVQIDKGCNAFAYSSKSNIFVTGGADKILRIWHPGIYTKPAGKLNGHIFSIVEIVINDADQHIISLSSARLVRVWDMHTLTSLQVFGDNENRPGERRIHCMIYDSKNEVLLTGSSVVDEWPIARKYHATILVPQTHPYAVLTMVVNVQLGQLLTSDTTPQLRVWEIDSGKLISQVNEAHGKGVEIVAAAFDPSGFRLVTGGINGSLRVWDFGSFQIIKSYNSAFTSDDQAILNLLYYDGPAVPGVNYILALGWGGKVKVFRDSNSDLDLVEIANFSEPDFQASDIFFTRLMDDTPEAMRSVLNAPIEDRIKIIADLMGNPGKKPMAELLSREGQSTLSSFREKSNLEEVLRYGKNRGMLLLEDHRTLITGSDYGHLIQWDLRTMEMEVKWRLSSQNSNETDSNSLAVAATPGRAKSTARDDFVPTPVSHTSMINVQAAEQHRVNAVLLVKPTLKRHRNKVDDDSDENSDQDDEEEEDEENEGGIEIGNADSKTPEPSQGVKQIKEASDGQLKNEKEPKQNKQVENEDEDEDDLKKLFNEMIENGKIAKSISLLISGHQDSWIRFWTMNQDVPNRVIHKVQMDINSHPSAVTSLCTDPDGRFLASGDYKGYVCVWTMQLMLPSNLKSKIIKHRLIGRSANGEASGGKLAALVDEAVPTFQLKFKVSFRAHNIKIEDVVYYPTHDILLTSSMDSSVRIWKGFTHKYLGFFGQPQHFIFTGNAYGPLTNPMLPDIEEKPNFPVTSEKVLERKRAARKIRDLPLIVDRSRWERNQSAKDDAKRRFWQPKSVKDKYFNLLVKPKLQNSIATAGNVASNVSKAGSQVGKLGVYRSLVTYGVTNTDDVQPRQIDFTALGN